MQVGSSWFSRATLNDEPGKQSPRVTSLIGEIKTTSSRTWPHIARRRLTSPAQTDPSARGASSQPQVCSRSEEHTSELQSHSDLVCRLLLEKKKKQKKSKKHKIKR